MIGKVVYVLCDTCLEPSWFTNERTVAEARATARAHGWKRTRGGDICDKCHAERQPAVDAESTRPEGRS